MDVVDTFGKVLSSQAAGHPDRARRILLAGWRAQLAKLSALPDRRLPPSRRYMSRVAMDEIVQALSRPGKAAAMSLFAPSEAVLAAGLFPLSVEQMSCFLGGSHAEQAFLEQAGDAGFPETLCSYHRVFLGAFESGLILPPACVVYTNVACDGNMITFPHIAQRMGVPSFCIDVPFERSEESVAEVARQLRELVAFLGEVTGVSVTEESLRVHVRRAWESACAYRRFLAASPERRLPADMVTEMYAFMANHVLLGSAEALHFCTELARDMEKAGKSDGIRLVWLHTMPFSQQPVIESLNFQDRAFITSCDLAADPALIDVDPEKPYDAMARRLVYSCFNGPSEARINRALDLVDRTQADGVVIFNHWGCKATLGSAQLMRDAIESQGVSCLVLDGDGIDEANRSDGQTATRLGAFLEMLEAKGAHL